MATFIKNLWYILLGNITFIKKKKKLLELLLFIKHVNFP